MTKASKKNLDGVTRAGMGQKAMLPRLLVGSAWIELT